MSKASNKVRLTVLQSWVNQLLINKTKKYGK